MREWDEGRAIADKPLKCPAKVKAAILPAIAQHIREHGRRNWDLVRERPEFAPWIGEAAGPSGRRKFFRWVEDVAKRLPKDRTRPHEARQANDDQFEWAKAQAQQIAHQQNLPIAVASRHLMAKGAKAVEGYAFLARQMANGFEDLERVRAAALVDDPNGIGGKSVIDPKLLLKTIQTSTTLVQTTTGLYREYNATWERAAFQDALLDMVEDKLAGHPELRDEVLSGFQDVVDEFGGVPPQAGSR
jgi:hypothetical protein